MDVLMPFFVALLVSSALTPLARLIAPRLGMVDRPSTEIKIHDRPVAVLGGLAAILACFIALNAAEPVMPWHTLNHLIAATVVVMVTGILDDRVSLPVPFRVAAQVAAGLLLVAGGMRLEPLGPLAAVGPVLLVLACANAINLIDGQDGLAGGLAAIAAMGMALMVDPPLALALALAGGLVGFIVFNMSPLRIFLGNGGAYAVGVMLAAVACQVATDWTHLVGAALCLGIFVFELVFTVVRRVKAGGRGLHIGDRNHYYDVLAQGIGRRGSTLVSWAAGAVTAAVGMVVASRGGWWVVAGLTIFCLASFLAGAASMKAASTRTPGKANER